MHDQEYWRLLHGRDEPLPDLETGGDPADWSFGLLGVLYAAGDLRYIRVGRREVVRRIYVGVRDAAWGTVPGVVSRSGWEYGPWTDREFNRRFRVEHRRGEVDFTWAATVEMRSRTPSDAEGIHCTVRFSMDGEAHSTFRTNRVGICVLHPVRECAGRACVVEHVDGTRTEGRFPDAIEPYQVFKSVRAITHEVEPGVTAEVRLHGDTFETEDQRNWADGSYKTYSRPLELPIPYVIEKGTRVRQEVTLTLRGPRARQVADPWWDVRIGDQALHPVPQLGAVFPAAGPLLTDRQVRRLKAAGLAHLRVDLDLAGGDGSVWPTALEEAAAVGLPLEVGLHLNGPAAEALRRVRESVERMRLPVCRWIVYEAGRPMPTDDLLALARRELGDATGGAPVGAGTVGSFAELNRNRPAAGKADVLAYPVSPQLHSTDDWSILENLEAQTDAAVSARGFAAGAQLAVGPVTLARRPDPFAAGKSGQVEPPAPEPRHASLLGAAWTLGSVKYLAEGGAHSITYYQAAGASGLMDADHVLPLYHVLADVAEFAGGEVVACECNEPLRVVALLLRKGDRMRLLMANLWPDFNVAVLEDVPEGWSITGTSVLEAGPSLKHAMGDPESFRAAPAGRRQKRPSNESWKSKYGRFEFGMLAYTVYRLDLERVTDE